MDDQIVGLKLKRDRGLIRFYKDRIWLGNEYSVACVVLTWADVGRELLPFLWRLGFIFLRIGSYSQVVFS